MAERQDAEFTLGSTWVLDVYCNDSNGSPLNLTGATVYVRICNNSAVVFDLTNGSGVTIQSPATAGIARAIVTKDMQAAIPEGVYPYEAKALLADGSTTDQAYGNLTIRCSLFRRYP